MKKFNLPQKISVKTVLALVATTMLLTSLLWYVFAATPTSTYWVTSGIYPSIPTYTTWIEGSYYHTKDENGLMPTWSGTTNFTAQGIQVLAALSTRGGGYWCIKEGAYTLDGALNIPSNTLVSGVSRVSTQITLKNNANTEIMLRNDTPQPFASGIGNYNITIQNLFLDGNNANQAGGQNYMGLIDFNNTLSAVVQHCLIKSGNSHGIRLVERGVARFMHNWITGNNGSGLFLGTHSDDSYIMFNDIGSSALNGISTSGGGHRHIAQNNIQLSDFDGISVTGGGGDVVTGNRILANDRHGIHIHRTVRMTIANNVIVESDYDADNTGSAIRVNGEVATVTNATTISGNTIYDCARGIQLYDYSNYTTITGNTIYECIVDYGIWERNNCDYTFVVGNTVWDCNTLGIVLSGANSECHSCWNNTAWVT